MKVFIIGYSGHGKSPMARHLADATNLQRIKASGWVSALTEQKFNSRAERTAALTKLSLEALAKDPNVSMRYMLENISECEFLIKKRIRKPGIIIDGMRNPVDFIRLFNPKEDIVFWLSNAYLKHSTMFEYHGITAITSYLSFLSTSGLMEPWRLKWVSYEYFWNKDLPERRCGGTTSLEEEIEDTVQWFTTIYQRQFGQ